MHISTGAIYMYMYLHVVNNQLCACLGGANETLLHSLVHTNMSFGVGDFLLNWHCKRRLDQVFAGVSSISLFTLEEVFNSDSYG